MSTELEQVVREYYDARELVRQTIRETNGKNLNITPEMVRRIRAAEEALLKAGAELSTDTQILRSEA